MVKGQQVRTLEEEFEVEKIAGKKVQDGKVLYLIKWRGFSDSDSTWEPIEHMIGSMDLVHQYESDHATRPKVAKKCAMEKPKRKRLMKAPAPSLEVEDWSVVEEEPKPKARRVLRKAKPGSFDTDAVQSIARVIKADGKLKFEVGWKERAGVTPANSVVTLEELEEKEPKMLISFFIKMLGI